MVEINLEPAVPPEAPEPSQPEPAAPLKGLIVLGSEDAEACSDGTCL